MRASRRPYGRAVDFRHRYREDIALARAMGVNIFRLGISWERVEPKKGQFDEAELAYCDDVIRALHEAGMRPLVTLHHFTHPGWVEDQGGWSHPRTVDDYLDLREADRGAMVSSNMAWTGDANLRSRVVERFLAWVFQDQVMDHADYIALDDYSAPTVCCARMRCATACTGCSVRAPTASRWRATACGR